MRFLPARIASLVLLGLTLGASAAPSLEPDSAELGSRGFRMPTKRDCKPPLPDPAPVPTSTSQPEKTPTPKPKPAPEVVPKFPKTFKNPIKQGTGADPWVVYSNMTDKWYLAHSAGGGIKITPTSDLSFFDSSKGTVVWKPPKEFHNLWAPELHYLDGAWYVYVAMDDGNNKNHRMYVLKGTDSKDPTKPFKFVGKITSPDDNWAIDGTVMRYTPTKTRYFVWSGWEKKDAGFPQNLYIAKMCSPTKICSDRVLIHTPNADWQKSQGKGVNEGPQILQNGNRWFIVYSAAGSWGDDYSLALMGIDGGKDPLKKKNWWAIDDRPVMWRNDEAGVWGPGHASFTYDRKGDPYVVYHAVAKKGAGWSGRTIRTEKFKWNKDGSPWFPRPASLDKELPHPQ